MPSNRRLAAIVFTDLEGFTSFAQDDEPRALEAVREVDRLVRFVLANYHGRKVKSTGDGLLLEFADVLNAVEGAVAILAKVEERNHATPGRPIRLRIGIHLGDVEGEGRDVLGDAVNIAARVEPLAEGGGICVTSQVYDQVRNKVDYPFESLGPRSLKGLKRPMEIYRLRTPDGKRAGTAAEVGGPPRIAVLPLSNISPDPNDEYFADGLTEEMISVLSQIRGLRVISRTSVNQYKGTAKPVGQIGAELGVGAVLEGSVRRSGDQLRITVQLIDVRTDEHRWAQTYDRKLDNVFAIQADVAQKTAGALQLQLLRSEEDAILAAPTRSMEAHDAYLRALRAGRGYFDERESEPEALAAFERAIELDPEFAAAYAQYADFLVTTMGLTRPARDVFPRADRLIAKALELDPNLSDAHMARGNLAMQRDHDWEVAASEFGEAMRLNPSNSRALQWLGYLDYTLQRTDSAAAHVARSIELDPLWPLPQVVGANLAVQTGDFGGALEQLDEMGRRFPENRAVLATLSNVYLLTGENARAEALVAPYAGTTDPSLRALRATVLASVGRPEELDALVVEWEQGKVPFYVALPIVAGSYVLVGETETALDLVEQDWRQGDRCLWAYYQNRNLDPIRDQPRFRTILEAMRLPTKLVRPLWELPRSAAGSRRTPAAERRAAAPGRRRTRRH